MTELVEETRLTDEGFWEHFWASLSIPSRINLRASSERCLSRAFLKFLPDGQGKKLIEIGAAPGRWLVFFQEMLGYEVDGIEYIPAASRKTEENLAACGITGRVFQQDFFHNDLPKHSYDVVVSLGFIEHFTDLHSVVSAHISLLKPGGHLVLGVPNLRGIHGSVERLTDPETLAAHNLDVMNMAFMERLATEYAIMPLWIGYIGGINPGLISVASSKVENSVGIAEDFRRKRSDIIRFLLRGFSFIRNRITPLDHLNGPAISGYLLAIYEYTLAAESPHESAGQSVGIQ